MPTSLWGDISWSGYTLFTSECHPLLGWEDPGNTFDRRMRDSWVRSLALPLAGGGGLVVGASSVIVCGGGQTANERCYGRWRAEVGVKRVRLNDEGCCCYGDGPILHASPQLAFNMAGGFRVD